MNEGTTSSDDGIKLARIDKSFEVSNNVRTLVLDQHRTHVLNKEGSHRCHEAFADGVIIHFKETHPATTDDKKKLNI